MSSDQAMPAPSAEIASRRILGMRVDATSYEDAAERILGWGRAGESRYVSVATVNNVMHAYDDPVFAAAMDGADLVTPDGMPLVWGLRALGVPAATRVYGPALTPVLCARAARESVPVGFLGSTPDVLDDMVAVLRDRLPGLRVAFAASPPFRAPTPEERTRTVHEINQSGTRVLFVGLGTPKQDLWMAEHRGQIQAAMVGVGAAFDFIAGRKAQAPAWMQGAGLEWLFRLVHEPGRLWRRYMVQNPRFLSLFCAQLARERLRSASA
jgi:N-acetylglucosaminyldiphosphoundecaprenol N-acetyl-beta-D-mannosaminyltransferase